MGAWRQRSDRCRYVSERAPFRVASPNARVVSRSVVPRAHAMTNRRAFTLLELIVSIVVAGIIALLAYASASAGFDTRDALERYRTTAEAELRARSLITDAFRHASDEGDPGVPALELLDGMDPGGLPADQLTFLTRGVLPPLGASTLWSVMLTPSAKGLSLRAAPVGSSTGAVTARLPNVRGLDVQVM